MPDETTKNYWPEQKSSIGTGEGEAPLSAPPRPKIDIRTMDSDLKTANQAGGGEPRSYTPPPSTPMPMKEIQTPSAKPQETSFEEILEKNVMNPPSIPGVPIPPPPIPADLGKIKAKKKKGFFSLIVVLILLIGVAALGYFVVYPQLSKAPGNGTIATPPTGTDNNVDSSQNAAVCGNGNCEAGEDALNCPADCQPALPPPAVTHTSLFKIPADQTIQAGEAQPTNLPQFSVVEINGPFAQVIAGYPDSLKNSFSETEYTVFTYVDSNTLGAGGFILKLKEGSDLAGTKSAWTSFIEDPENASVKNYGSIYGGDAQIGSWKTGQAGIVATRYLTLGSSKYALNYGWLGDELVFASTYNAFKEAVRRLQ